MTISLRRAVEANVEDYVRIEKKVASRINITITDPQEVLERIQRSVVYMILENELVVGLVTYEFLDSQRVYIKKLAVDPVFQGKGVGGEAFRLIMEELAAITRVELVTHPENPTLPLFLKHGFVIDEYIENFKETGEPRYFLVRALNVVEK